MDYKYILVIEKREKLKKHCFHFFSYVFDHAILEIEDVEKIGYIYEMTENSTRIILNKKFINDRLLFFRFETYEEAEKFANEFMNNVIHLWY